MKKRNLWKRTGMVAAFAVTMLFGTHLTANAETIGVTNIMQTDATETTATVNWETAAPTSVVYVNGVYAGVTQDKTYTVNGLVPGSTSIVSVIGYNGDTGYASPEELIAAYVNGDATLGAQFMSYNAGSVPGKPQDFAKSTSESTLKWKPTADDYVTLGWTINPNDTYYASGWQLQISSVNGKKKLKTYDVAGQRAVAFNHKFKLKAVKNTGFSAKVRGYVKMTDGSKRYGAWSKKAVVIPPAKINVTKKSNSSVNIKWSKVKNATKYEVYVCKNYSQSNTTYKKVATVKAGKTSYVLKKIPNETPYSVYVRPVVKYGKKTYKAQVNDSYSFRFVTRYY